MFLIIFFFLNTSLKGSFGRKELLQFKPNLNCNIMINKCDSFMQQLSDVVIIEHLPTIFTVKCSKEITNIYLKSPDSLNGYFNTILNAAGKNKFTQLIYKPAKYVLTDDYISQNTNLALNVWGYPWNSFLTVDQFCEYVLPYRSYRSVYFTGDREWIFTLFKDTLEAISTLQIDDDLKTERVIASVNNWFKSVPKIDTAIAGFNLPHLGIHNLFTFARGSNCSYHVDFMAAALRALGVPVCIEYGPKTMQSPNHFWLYVPLPSGRKLPFNAFDLPSKTAFGDVPGAYIKYFRITNKVQDKNIFTYMKREDVIPSQFLDPTIIDVSNTYRASFDVKVNIENKINSGIVYLYKFNQGLMKELMWAPAPNEKGYVDFRNLRANFFYFPGLFNQQGYIPAGNVFWLREDGLVKEYTIDTLIKERVVLKRKERARQGFLMGAKQMRGDKIWGSNDSTFKNKTLLLEITDSLGLHLNHFSVSDKKEFKFIKYESKNRNLNLAEFELLTTNTKVADSNTLPYYIGDTLSTDTNKIVFKKLSCDVLHLSKFYKNKYISDGDPLTFSDEAELVLKLNDIERINAIRIYPRSAVNIVERGDIYELKYYYENQWISLGVQRATFNFLLYENVPKGAILWLRNLTKGKEESLFEYINGVQVFR